MCEYLDQELVHIFAVTTGLFVLLSFFMLLYIRGLRNELHHFVNPNTFAFDKEYHGRRRMSAFDMKNYEEGRPRGNTSSGQGRRR